MTAMIQTLIIIALALIVVFAVGKAALKSSAGIDDLETREKVQSHIENTPDRTKTAMEISKNTASLESKIPKKEK